MPPGNGCTGIGAVTHRRVDAGAVAMTASIFEPHILQDLRLHLNVKLFGNGLAHAMHPAMTAGAGLLIVGKVIFDALARQVFRQRLASTFLGRRFVRGRQPGVRQINNSA
ncbi:hypothetical protein SIAM614_00317 [Stappia aggregata IAM 12614]|nr:hypothetical protein SIAM614_00317 [Stappia aggregata IAM 12614] [Roseibium aggregatum IAM 12614]